MSRPKSMPDFSALMDASAPLYDRERPRKKPSISLAAGLIMNSESPRNSPSPFQQQHRTQDKMEGGWSDNLFYAYAQKSDFSHSPPYLLTFASAAVCEQWWSLVQREYPESARLGPQLFILKGDDMQVQIQDNPKFYDLRNKWFYTPGDATSGAAAVIPLQDYKGNPVSAPPLAPSPQPATIAESDEKQENAFDMSKLNDTLEKMSALIADNASQIQALGVAQSAGLQRMQEINETNSIQIKALADSQMKLQALVDQNASHYIALSNSSFQNQEQLKEVLQSNAAQIKTIAEGQTQLSQTCQSMMSTIESLGTSVGRVNDSISHMGTNGAGMDAASVGSAPSSVSSFSAMANRISPPPRKLNRRIKGVWYEYDTTPSQVGSPRRDSHMLDTPPKTPLTAKNA